MVTIWRRTLLATAARSSSDRDFISGRDEKTSALVEFAEVIDDGFFDSRACINFP
jgi:hypothetical protein